MSNGWTGGQYSLYRVLFGFCLLGGFVARFEPRPLAVSILVAGCAGCCAFIVGWRDRWAAMLIFGLSATSLILSSRVLHAGHVFVGWLLFAHTMLPAAPFGSFDAIGRPDPRGGWYVSRPIYLGTWGLMAAWYSFRGFSMLVHPGWLRGEASLVAIAAPGMAWLLRGVFLAHLFFLPLSFFRPLRPWLWSAFATMHLASLAYYGEIGLSGPLLILHAFTFDPAWIPPRGSRSTDTVFFDGHCGLCNSAVRFLLSEDIRRRFEYAPLDSDEFRSMIPESGRRTLPDSVVVLTAAGRLLVRSSAVLFALARLGGVWRLLGAVGSVVPAPLRDAVYDFISKHRPRARA